MKRRLHHFLIFMSLCLAIGGIGLSNSVLAQDRAPTSPAPPLHTDKMDNVPDEYIEEASAIYDECAGDHAIRQYYNCECRSLAYLDERIQQGPVAQPLLILQAIDEQCRDAVEAAGEVYLACLRKANRFEPGTDPEKYCECVANKYVEEINTFQPAINSQNIVRFQVRAYLGCQGQ